MTTDTPRTDELDYNQDLKSYRIWDLARQLERELAASKAEVERLTNALDQMTRDAMATAKDRDEWMTKASMTIS